MSYHSLSRNPRQAHKPVGVIITVNRLSLVMFFPTGCAGKVDSDGPVCLFLSGLRILLVYLPRLGNVHGSNLLISLRLSQLAAMYVHVYSPQLAGQSHPLNSVYVALEVDGTLREYFRVGPAQESPTPTDHSLPLASSGPAEPSYARSTLERYASDRLFSLLRYQNKLSRLLKERERLASRCSPALYDEAGLARKVRYSHAHPSDLNYKGMSS